MLHADAIQQFLDSQWLERQLSENTLAAYRRDLLQFANWLEAENQDWKSLSHEVILRFLATLSTQSARTQARKLSALRGFFRYAVEAHWIARDPCTLIVAPKLPRALPHVLSEDALDLFLQVITGNDPIAIRDRAMVEILYATGLRISELITLTLPQINLRQGVIRVLGKGNKERLVPLGEQAEYWLMRYLKEARGTFLKTGESDIVFLSPRAQQPLTRQAFWYRIQYWAKRAGILQPLSPHGLRHAFATHLVNHGADLRVVQMLLGHESLSTTQIYTAVANVRLKQLHATHHPRG